MQNPQSTRKRVPGLKFKLELNAMGDTRDRGKSFRIRRYAVAAPPLVKTKRSRFHHTMNGCSQKFEGVFFAYYSIAHINFK